LLVNKSAKEIVLKDVQGKIIAVPTKSVESIVPQRVSLMPELLLRDMTPREVADLLEFLSSLK